MQRGMQGGMQREGIQREGIQRCTLRIQELPTSIPMSNVKYCSEKGRVHAQRILNRLKTKNTIYVEDGADEYNYNWTINRRVNKLAHTIRHAVNNDIFIDVYSLHFLWIYQYPDEPVPCIPTLQIALDNCIEKPYKFNIGNPWYVWIIQTSESAMRLKELLTRIVKKALRLNRITAKSLFARNALHYYENNKHLFNFEPLELFNVVESIDIPSSQTLCFPPVVVSKGRWT